MDDAAAGVRDLVADEPAEPIVVHRGLRVVALLLLGAVGLFVILYAASLHASSGNSDGATVILEGQSISQGHLTLSHWSLSLDSFWTIDALFSAVAIAVAGLHAQLLHAVPAAIAVMVIGLGGYLAGEGRRGAARIAAAVTVVISLGLPSRAFSLFFLQGPLHVGTTLWCLIAFSCLVRGRFGPGFVVATVFLAAGVVGDAQTLTLGVAPVAAAGVVAMIRRRRLAPGLPAVVCAAAAVVLALALRGLALVIGTYSINPEAPSASFGQALSNLRDVGTLAPSLFGITTGPFGADGVPAGLGWVHFVGLLLVLAAAFVGLVGLLATMLFRPTAEAVGPTTTVGEYWLSDVLLLALLADLATFAKLDMTGDPSSARYLTAGVITGVILAGRLVGLLVDALGSARVRWLCGGLAGAVVAVYLAAFCLQFSGPAAGERPAVLGRFLSAHHLTDGIADYWTASIVTVDTDGAVTLRPVIDGPAGRVVRYGRQSDADWYTGRSFGFLVFDTTLPLVDASDATATFGTVTKSYAVDGYEVLVFAHRLRVSVHGAIA
jgi:hypothetical protein